MERTYRLELEVRDHECDVQGIVNNSVYLNYLEHARHKMIKEQGIDFTQLAKKGVNLIVVRTEIDYKSPLVAGDRFFVHSVLAKESRLKIAFYQTIKRIGDDKLIVKAKVLTAAVDSKFKPLLIEQVAEYFKF